MPERKRLVAGNWKMNLLRADGSALARQIAERARRRPGLHRCDLLVCPPFTLLASVGEALAGSGVALGGQDCHPQAAGAFTGCVSAEMLKDAGCSHRSPGIPSAGMPAARPTRRCGEDAGGVARRACRDRLRRRDQGGARGRSGVATSSGRQLAGSLPEDADAERLIVAYEPVWAIGTGLTPTIDDIAAIHAAIRGSIPPVRGSCTAARSTRKTPPRSLRSTRSTARWSAVPASRPTISGPSCRRRGRARTRKPSGPAGSRVQL